MEEDKIITIKNLKTVLSGLKTNITSKDDINDYMLESGAYKPLIDDEGKILTLGDGTVLII